MPNPLISTLLLNDSYAAVLSLSSDILSLILVRCLHDDGASEVHNHKQYYKLLAAQNPNAIVNITPPKLKIRMGASPPSSVVPTRSPTFLAYRRRGPEHCGQRNPGPCSSKYIPAHSACRFLFVRDRMRVVFVVTGTTEVRYDTIDTETKRETSEVLEWDETAGRERERERKPRITRDGRNLHDYRYIHNPCKPIHLANIVIPFRLARQRISDYQTHSTMLHPDDR